RTGGTGLVAERDDEDGERRLRGRGSALVREREHHAFEPHPEPDTRDARATERLGEPVIAAATDERRLLLVATLLQGIGHELERRARVVVESTDERRCEDRVDPGIGETLPDVVER